MGKNTLFTGQPVFSQILNLINRSNIQEISRKEGYDRYVKKLDGYTHLVLLIYGILKRYDSLRELVIGVLSEANKLGHLGIDYMVRRSTLAEANNRRSRYTSAAMHDYFMLKVLELPKGSFLAIDRAYIDYEAFERMTASGTYYVTKMKKNLTYKVIESRFIMDKRGLATYHESVVEFNKDEIRHKTRIVENWNEDGKHIVLMTNNFELSLEEIVEIYARIWEIELLFKQLKQNFPLKYFYGDSVNAIKTQIWVTLIANLLLSVVRKRVRRSWGFSNLATTICHMLMHYIDLFKYLENPEQIWRNIAKSQIRQSGKLELFST